MHRYRHGLFGVVIVLFSIVQSPPPACGAGVLPVVEEIEPNDQPQQGLAFKPPALLSGILAPADQDAYTWRLSDADALKRWTLTLHGIPGVLTGASIVRVTSGPDPRGAGANAPDVLIDAKTLLRMDVRDGADSITRRDLFLPAGDHVVGLFSAGQGSLFRPPTASSQLEHILDDDAQTPRSGRVDDAAEANSYRLAVTPGRSTSVSASVDNHSRDNALDIRPGGERVVVARGVTWYVFDLDENSADSGWTLEGEVMLERRLSVTLTDQAGAELAATSSNGHGRYRLPNLALDPGRYFIRLDDGGEPPSARSVRLVKAGHVSDKVEGEPNDDWAHANAVSLDTPLSGRVDTAGERDYFEFAVSDAANSQGFDLTLNAPGTSAIQICLLDDSGVSRMCRSGEPPVVLDSLRLNAGRHGLLVSRSNEPVDYEIRRSGSTQSDAGTEHEPNDKRDDANVFASKPLIRGTLPAGDQDHFTLYVAGAPQLWRLQAIGKHLRDLQYHPHDGRAGQSVRAANDARRLRLDNLYLLPGMHHFSLNANSATRYVLRAIALGPPSPQIERETNNDRHRAQLMTVGDKRIGLLSETTDTDYFSFHLPAARRIRLQLRVPPDGRFRAQMYWDGGALKDYRPRQDGDGVDDVMFLQPGDYFVQVSATTASELEYELELTPEHGPWRISDSEPNDNAPNANDFPPSLTLEGVVGTSHGDVEWYRLPESLKGRSTTVRINDDDTAGSIYPSVLDGSGGDVGTLEPVGAGQFTMELPADRESFFYLSGKGEYRVEFEAPDSDGASPLETLPLTISFDSAPAPLAAYRDVDQHTNTVATLSNQAEKPLTLRLQARTSDDKWRVDIDTREFTLEPGERRDVPLSIRVAPDAWPDIPVNIELLAFEGNRAATSETLTLSAERFRAPLNPSFSFLLPGPLRGSVNVAAAALGASMITTEGSGLDALIDGVTALGHYFQGKRQSPTGPVDVRPVVDLAGDAPVEVIGIAFHPFGLQGTGPGQRNARRVEVDLSMDGEHFEPALNATLSAHTQEQAFVLPAAMRARFARLTVRDSRAAHIAALGEWKVLATADTLTMLDRSNIALPELGGHVTWVAPAWPGANYDNTLITAEDDATTQRAWPDTPFEWVIGFQHNRAARIDALAWRDHDDIGAGRFHAADVFASTVGPLGPWQSLGTWPLDDSGESRFELEEPVWARFLRFVGHTKITGGQNVYFPDQIEVFEARDHSPGSVLAEWGQNNSDGPYELHHSPLSIDSAMGPPDHTKKSRALALDGGVSFDSRVRLGHYQNWYRITVPEGHNRLTASLSGAPTVNAKAELEDAAGETIAWSTRQHANSGDRYQAFVAPGEYFIRVTEPPRSVILTWDTSGSTAKVRHIIRQAVQNYIKDVKPGLDVANLLPFGGDFLSQRWIEQPYRLQGVLNDYNGAGDSSAAETALVTAAERLRDRRGQKIIVLVTDAATTRDLRLWSVLDEVRPRIIALGVSSVGAFSSKPVREQDLLQDWAASGAGYYNYVETVGGLARAYDRAASRIRQPAAYRILTSTAQAEPARPGSLHVSTAPSAGEAQLTVPGAAIEVILDASGSMLQRLGSQRRYQVAKSALAELIEHQLPESTLFALRVFGHKETGSCRTDLEIPLSPLNRTDALGILDGVVPKNLAKTPIAASLTAAGADMKQHDGRKIILLVTDGEETCDGEPEQAIVDLRQSGIQASVNIVGFALNDEALITRFRRWAKRGDGAYRSAATDEELTHHIAQLTSAQFFLIHPGGERSGPYFSDGEPIPLDPGRYTVRFRSGQETKVEVASGQKRTVTFVRGAAN